MSCITGSQEGSRCAGSLFPIGILCCIWHGDACMYVGMLVCVHMCMDVAEHFGAPYSS